MHFLQWRDSSISSDSTNSTNNAIIYNTNDLCAFYEKQVLSIVVIVAVEILLLALVVSVVVLLLVEVLVANSEIFFQIFSFCYVIRYATPSSDKYIQPYFII